MTLFIFALVTFIVIFIIAYRKNSGQNVYKYISSQVTSIYDKYAPYSFKDNKLVREFLSKARENMKLIEEHQRLEQNTSTNK